MSGDGIHLFGLPEAEVMYLDASTVYEAEIEPHCNPEDGPWVVEEWSSHEAHENIPHPEWIVEWIAESSTEELDDDGRTMDKLSADPEMLSLAAQLHDRAKALIIYRQADQKLAEHGLSVVDGVPLLDRQPLYVEATP